MKDKEFASLNDVAKDLKKSNKKVTLLYAFNATGKTRLSMKFKDLVNETDDSGEEVKHIIYFNAFTEDLFYWDNDLENNLERILKINTSSAFITLIKNQGMENRIAEKFREFASSKIEPQINVETGEITFSIPTGDNEAVDNIKISKGEESIFIWSVFYVLLETIISELNEDKEDRSTNEFNQIHYIFIDDPISSLDDNNAIDTAIDLKELIVGSRNEDLHFIISTHHALFYNVLFNELRRDRNIKDNKVSFFSLQKKENEIGYVLNSQNDSPFGYHLIVKEEIENAIKENRIKKYHFLLFRNLLEKTATYLGYKNWSELIIGDDISEDNRNGYVRRINLYSHSKQADLEYKELRPEEKNMLKLLFNNFIKEFKWEVKND
ncbi:AAA family ATPase [Lactobacillus sp. ESL0701]|uniref:AAA family ATPase n=1 Tax=Lactobacillus sp. ESL0701 TaxID=2983217 RepID=UPI0023F7A3C6|nr:AAA family ATPase [Lactobacillus sp. ESL0701]MDF7673085.1 AAA family ATPase [Lactobacillus sp. ESL0701]